MMPLQVRPQRLHSRRDFVRCAAVIAGMAASVDCRQLFAEPFPEYGEFDALGLAELVRQKKSGVRPEDLLEAAIQRVEAANGSLNAVVVKMYDEARASIRRGLPDGRFTGVPFLLKDLGATYAGVRNTSGSKLLATFVPDYDNELVKRYKQAGLVVFGRTNSPEFGLNVTTEPTLHGPARNPWSTDRSTGGSSGGSGAAVAARLVPMAHGNDGGGSIRIPSSCCGVFGMKPSRGRMPTGPNFGDMWEGLATHHALTLSVRDNAALLDATSGPELGAPYGIPAPRHPFLDEVRTDPRKLRIAWTTRGAAEQIHEDCQAAVKDAARLCESLGHIVEESAPGIDFEPLLKAFKLVIDSHTAAMLDRLSSVLGEKVTSTMVESSTWVGAEMGWKASAADFAATKVQFNLATRGVAKFLENNRFDVLLTPTLGTPPPKLGAFDTAGPFDQLRRAQFDFIPFTWLHNVTGLPAMSVPLYWNADGLPIGVQFAAPYADEATLYQLAGQLERARPWRGKVPPAADRDH